MWGWGVVCCGVVVWFRGVYYGVFYFDFVGFCVIAFPKYPNVVRGTPYPVLGGGSHCGMGSGGEISSRGGKRFPGGGSYCGSLFFLRVGNNYPPLVLGGVFFSPEGLSLSYHG